MVHKTFYASGFLYHPGTDQILLQQDSNDPKPLWSLLGSKSTGDETSEEIFKRTANSVLRLNLLTKSVHRIYDYGKNYVYYTEVKKLTDFPAIGKTIFAWFSIREVAKLPLSPQTKQDILVGQRVIDLASRKKTGEQIAT